MDEVEHLLDIFRDAVVGIDLETDGGECGERLGMLAEDVPAAAECEIREEIEAALRNDVRLERANGPSGGVAGICELLELQLLALGIHALETCERHDDLSADFEICGHSGFFQGRRRNR